MEKKGGKLRSPCSYGTGCAKEPLHLKSVAVPEKCSFARVRSGFQRDLSLDLRVRSVSWTWS